MSTDGRICGVGEHLGSGLEKRRVNVPLCPSADAGLMGCRLSVTVPRSSIEDGLSLVIKKSPSVFEIAGVGKLVGGSMTISKKTAVRVKARKGGYSFSDVHF
jgi:hypothetical protein